MRPAATRTYLLAPRCVVRDATAALLTRAGHRVIGADGDAGVAEAELLAAPADLLLADLRWGCLPLLQLIDRWPAARAPRLVAWLHEQGQEDARHQLPPARLHAWVPAMASSQTLIDTLAQVAEGQRLPPPWGLQADDEMPLLAPLERQLLRDTALGRALAGMAREAGLPARRLAEHRRVLMQRLGLRDVSAVVRFALRHGLIDGV